MRQKIYISVIFEMGNSTLLWNICFSFFLQLNIFCLYFLLWNIFVKTFNLAQLCWPGCMVRHCPFKSFITEFKLYSTYVYYLLSLYY